MLTLAGFGRGVSVGGYFLRVVSGACTNGDGNQLTERPHNMIREKDKVVKGWKKDDTPIRKGHMLWYNSARSHTRLEGKTPAEVAG